MAPGETTNGPKVAIHCDPAALRVEVGFEPTAFHTSRAVLRESVEPRALARTTVLLAAELVVAAQATAPDEPEEEREAVPPEPIDTSLHGEPEPRDTDAPRTGWTFDVSGRWALGRSGLFGARTGVRIDWGAVSFGASLGGEYGADSFAIGDTESAGIYAAPELLLWLPFEGRAQLGIGAIVAVGYARVSGTTDRNGVVADSVGGFWAKPGVRAEFRFRAAGPLDLRIGLDFGFPVAQVVSRVDNEERGPWNVASISGYLGVAVVP